MYEAADHGAVEPVGMPLFVVTHRPQDAPSEGGFTFVKGLDKAIGRARQAEGGKDISVEGVGRDPPGTARRTRRGTVDLDRASHLGGGKRCSTVRPDVEPGAGDSSSHPSPRTSRTGSCPEGTLGAPRMH